MRGHTFVAAAVRLNGQPGISESFRVAATVCTPTCSYKTTYQHDFTKEGLSVKWR
jgi:hypothetical protein